MISLTYDWERAYVDAILETEDSKLPALIAAAQSTILARVDQLNMDHCGTPEERSYLATALAGLHTLKRERLAKRNGE
jgi:hypothetical protein